MKKVVDFNAAFAVLDIQLDSKQNAALNKEYGDYAEIIGELLALLDRSELALERKVFFQAAILDGYFDEDLLREILKEVEEANEKIAQNIAQLNEAVESGKSDLNQLAEQYVESAKALRHMKEALRQALAIRVERNVEAVGKTKEASAIAAISSQLKKHGKK